MHSDHIVNACITNELCVQSKLKIELTSILEHKNKPEKSFTSVVSINHSIKISSIGSSELSTSITTT